MGSTACPAVEAGTFHQAEDDKGEELKKKYEEQESFKRQKWKQKVNPRDEIITTTQFQEDINLAMSRCLVIRRPELKSVFFLTSYVA